MFATRTLFPAYGKTYADADAMLKGWQDGKDFSDGRGGPYCSIRDHQHLIMDTVVLMSRDGKIVVYLK